MLDEQHSLVVIDDDVLTHELVDRRLRDVPCEVAYFSDALKGLEYLKQERPDTLIVNQKMPRLNGLDLLRELGDARPCQIFIASSGVLPRTMLAVAKSCGAEFVAKDSLIQQRYLANLLGLG